MEHIAYEMPRHIGDEPRRVFFRFGGRVVEQRKEGGSMYWRTVSDYVWRVILRMAENGCRSIIVKGVNDRCW